MKEQISDFQPSPASEALEQASNVLRDAYQKKLLIIAKSSSQVAFIKRGFDQNYWMLDEAHSVEQAVEKLASEPNYISIVDFGDSEPSINTLLSSVAVQKLFEVSPNAIIIGVSSIATYNSIPTDLLKRVWDVVVGDITASTLKSIQDTVHAAWRSRINRAEMELAQRVKIVELMKYENIAAREYGIRQACSDLSGELTEVQNTSRLLETDLSIPPSIHLQVEKIAEGLKKIEYSINQVRNLMSESETRHGSIRL